MSVSTCSGPVVGGLVWRAVDEAPQGGDSVGPHQDVTAECPAVHHPDVERRVEKLILWKVLRTKLRHVADEVKGELHIMPARCYSCNKLQFQ